MKATKYVLYLLLFTLCMAVPVLANTGNISTVIERFVSEQFPKAQSHFWVVNSTEWSADNEVVVDLNTMVVTVPQKDPTESRFLLLIVDGKLAGAQSIPLDAHVDCKPDEVTL
jgi:hypothetical protein